METFQCGILDAGEAETELLGDMPVGSQFGYLLSKNNPDQLSVEVTQVFQLDLVYCAAS